MIPYTLKMPSDFLDYEWEVEAKGCFFNAFLQEGQNEYQLQFYDPTRLAQEIADALAKDTCFYEENLVVVQVVNLRSIENAVRKLVEKRLINSLSALVK